MHISYAGGAGMLGAYNRINGL